MGIPAWNTAEPDERPAPGDYIIRQDHEYGPFTVRIRAQAGGRDKIVGTYGKPEGIGARPEDVTALQAIRAHAEHHRTKRVVVWEQFDYGAKGRRWRRMDPETVASAEPATGWLPGAVQAYHAETRE